MPPQDPKRPSSSQPTQPGPPPLPRPRSPLNRGVPSPKPSSRQASARSVRPPAPSPGSRPRPTQQRARPIPTVYAASRPATLPPAQRSPRKSWLKRLGQRLREVGPSNPDASDTIDRSGAASLLKGAAVSRPVTLRDQAVPPSEPTQPRAPYAASYRQTAIAVESLPDEPAPRRRHPLAWFRWIASWQFLLLTTIAIVSGAGAFSVVSLFRIPNLPNCRAIFWPTASASLRLQCADSYADQGTVDFYLEAIALVDRLPEDHPLRGDINARLIGRDIALLAHQTQHQ